MIEKDISQLKKEQLIQKYNNMKNFVIVTGLAEGMSESYIREHYNIDIEKKPITFNVDLENQVKVRALNCKVYRNEHKQILMIETEDFVVIS